MSEYLFCNALLAWALGWPEILLLLVLALLIFGGKRLPEVMRSIGRGLSEFKKGIHEAEKTKDEVVDEAKDAAGIDELEKKD